MPRRLRKEEVVTVQVLAEKGQNHCEIGRVLGVTEGTVRYHLRRAAAGAEDGRKQRLFKAEPLAEVVAAWFAAHAERERPVNVSELFDHLVAEYDYAGSYPSVVRFVRSHYPRPRLRTYRRVETPPGAQSQTDWGEYPQVQVAGERRALHAFLMVLSHSRKPAIVWSLGQDELSWLRCHNESYRRLAGVAAVNRIDNVKTAVVQGAGAWGVIHPTYRAYARAVGFHIDACAPRQAQAKGKVEAKVRLSRLLLDPGRRAWASLEELQVFTDERVERWAERALCPATGKTVQESWQQELCRLASLPLLPELSISPSLGRCTPTARCASRIACTACPSISPAGAWKCGAAPARCRSSARGVSCASTRGAQPSASCSTRSATKARRVHGSWRRPLWAPWVGGCRRSTSYRSSGDRSIFTRPWRRWRDEWAGR